jgi:hypothetical protein
MSKRRCFWFAYAMPRHKDRGHLPFKLRDPGAAKFLLPSLVVRGYEYAGPIINNPSSGPELVAFDHGFLREDDLIFLTTRPPMNDLELGERKSIQRSFTDLEDKLFEGPLRARFQRCARTEVLLQNATARISPEIAGRQSMEFRQNGGATYQSYGSPYAGERRRFKRPQPLTAVFLVFAAHAWPGGPALLAAFGMGGNETFVWCHQLATRFSHLLFTTGFAMGEMRTTDLAVPPTGMDFANSWETTILGAEPLAPAADLEAPSGPPSL